MRAVRIHPSTSTTPHSPSNPAPTSALHVDRDIPIPRPRRADEVLLRVKASAVIRDMLTWPELLESPYQIPGADFSGVVESTFEGDEDFKPGDEVFGMSFYDPAKGDPKRDGTWAEYALAVKEEIALKPKNLGWEAAASAPLSALTAWQALFVKAELPEPGAKQEAGSEKKRVLLTGAAGGVGVYLIQLAAAAGFHVVAATSSNHRNEQFMKSLGAHEAVEYSRFDSLGAKFHAVIDCVGGKVLESCWPLLLSGGSLVSIDSSSFTFAEDQRKAGIGRDDVKAVFFIVEPVSSHLEQISKLLESGELKTFVAKTYALEDVRKAYDLGNGREVGRGKVILTIP